jgi:hypothetical protein
MVSSRRNGARDIEINDGDLSRLRYYERERERERERDADTNVDAFH